MNQKKGTYAGLHGGRAWRGHDAAMVSGSLAFLTFPLSPAACSGWEPVSLPRQSGPHSEQCSSLLQRAVPPLLPKAPHESLAMTEDSASSGNCWNKQCQATSHLVNPSKLTQVPITLNTHEPSKRTGNYVPPREQVRWKVPAPVSECNWAQPSPNPNPPLHPQHRAKQW